MAPIETYLAKEAAIEDGSKEHPLTHDNTFSGNNGGGYTLLHRILNASLEKPGQPIHFIANSKLGVYTYDASHRTFIEGVDRSTNIQLLLGIAAVSSTYNIALALREISNAK